MLLVICLYSFVSAPRTYPAVNGELVLVQRRIYCYPQEEEVAMNAQTITIITTGAGILLGGIVGFFVSRHFYNKDEKLVNEMKNAIKRIGHLSSQAKSVCASLDSLEIDLKNGKIGANSAESVLKPIKMNMEALNGELEAIYNEHMKK